MTEVPLNKKSKRYGFALSLLAAGCLVLWTKHQGGLRQQPNPVTQNLDSRTQSGPAGIPLAASAVNSAPTNGLPAGVASAISSTNSGPAVLETNRLAHPGIDAFSAWARQFENAAIPGAAASVVAQGEALAKNRRSELAELIQTDPEQALAAAVPMRVRQHLPLEITRHLEERVSGRGSLDVLVADNFETNKREVSREVTLGPGHYTAFVYGRRVDQGSIANVSLHGIAIDGRLALHEDAVRPLEPGEVSWKDASSKTCPVSGRSATIDHQPAAAEVGGRIEFFCGASHIQQLNQRLAAAGAGAGPGDGGVVAANSWSQGTKTLLFMRLGFADDPAEPITESDAYALLDGVNSWYVENSYNTTALIPTVTPLLLLPQTKAWYGAQGTSLLLSDARNAARAAGFDTANFDLDVVRHNSVPGFNWTGLGYVQGKGAWLQSSSAGVAIHELGHNYGLWHANFWTAPGDSIIGPGSHSEYGDVFDTMGTAVGGNNQFNAAQKNLLDWLPSTYVQTVTTNGTYRLFAFDVPNRFLGQSYALKIRKDPDRDYWAELRQKFTSNRWLQNGVLLHWDPWAYSSGGSQLLDTTPGTPTGNSSKDDAAVVVGRTFTDRGAGIHVTPVALGGTPPDNWIDVTVNVGAFPGNSPPLVSIDADQTAVAPSVPVGFTANATDPNGDPLAYYWDFGDQTFGSNAPTASKSWNNAGEYNVRCQVSDKRGGVASASVVITVGSPSTFRVSGRITTTGGAPVEGVRVHNGLINSSYRGAYTDSSGYYTIVGLSPGVFNFTAVKYGHTPASNGSWTNPISVGPNAENIQFVAAELPVVSMVLNHSTVAENSATPATLTLSRIGPTTAPLVVKYNRAGTATYLADYTLSPAPGASFYVTIPAGAASFDLAIQPLNDNLSEGPETVTLTLAEDAAYVLAYPIEGTVTILDNQSPTLPSVAVTASTASGDDLATESGADTGIFTFTRAGNLGGELAIYYSVGGTATGGLDYTPLSGVITLADGQGSATAAFTTIDDSLVEGNETVVITILTNAAYTITAVSSAVTIVDDDPTSVFVTATDNIATEQGASPGVFTFTRIGSLAAGLVIHYALGGTASNGVDYLALPGAITIPAGKSSAAVLVTPIDDALVEGTETVLATITSSPGYNVVNPSSATLTILDNEIPTVTLSVTDAVATEPGADIGRFMVSRGSATNGTLIVYFHLGGTAFNGVDYVALGNSVVIANGSATANITVIPIDDSIAESDETVTLQLVPDAAYNIGTAAPATVTLRDNDAGALPAIGFTSNTSSNYESTSTVRLSVVLSAASASTVTVGYYATGGTATGGGVDYTLNPGTLVFAPGVTTATIQFTLVNDGLYESNETLFVTLNNPVNATLDIFGTHVFTILDDDAAILTVTAIDASASETGPDLGLFRVLRAGTTNSSLTVFYEVTGTASSPSDYTTIGNSIVIPAGANYADIIVTPVHDNSVEPDETVTLTLTSAPGASIGLPNSATVTITDFAAGISDISVSIAATGNADEAGVTGVFTVTRNTGTNTDLTIHFTTGGTAGANVDFLALDNVIVLPAGAFSATIDVVPIDDWIAEANETVVVTLAPGQDYTVGSPASATLLILDNEPVVSVATSTPSIAESPTNTGVFVVTRAVSTNLPLIVFFIVSGTSSNGLDYDTLNSTVTFPPGATSVSVVVTPIADNLIEGNETVVLTLVADPAYTLGSPASATLTIQDTDTDLPPIIRITSPTVDTVYLTTTNATLVLEATVTDDGAPNPPAKVTATWSVLSGPDAAVFGDTNSLHTQVRFPTAGIYQLRLTASDGAHQSSSDLSVIFDAETNVNFAPVVTAGPPCTNALGESLQLSGNVTDDGNPTPPALVSITWSKWSGPGSVVFGNAASATSTASFAEPGTYVLCLLADDGQVRICDQMRVTVVVLPTVTIQAVETHAFELGEREGRFLVTRSGESNSSLNVRVIVSGTASNGVDYPAIADLVTIPAGSSSAWIPVTPIADGLAEGDETVRLTLGASPFYQWGSPFTATMVLRDAPWDAWRFSHFSPAELNDPNVSAEDADPDHDGQANIFEYAFNLDPHAAETNRVFTIGVEISPLDNEPYFMLSFKRRLSPSDMVYEVFVSDDLTHWESGTSYVQELAPATNDGNNVTETVRVRVNDPITQVPRRFVKLGVRRP